MFNFKKLIPMNIKKSLRIFLKKISAKYILARFLNQSDKKNIYIMGTPEHGNLGDHAIAFAQLELIRDKCKEFNVFEVPFSEVGFYLNTLKARIKDSDTIMLMGGGNFGDEYLREEELRRDIIINFPKQKIVIFPQTIFFSDNEKGHYELNKTVEIYSKHKDLIIVAREKISFDKISDIFVKNKAILTPDIVLYLNKSMSEEQRSGILTCFRNDQERIISKEYQKHLLLTLGKKYALTNTDTVVNYSVNKKQRKEKLFEIWSSFCKAELVITDRLHGMVFAAITGTPCIALSNYNQKVRGTYEWIKHLPYIKFVENQEEVLPLIEELLELEVTYYENNSNLKYYEAIVSEINAARK